MRRILFPKEKFEKRRKMICLKERRIEAILHPGEPHVGSSGWDLLPAPGECGSQFSMSLYSLEEDRSRSVCPPSLGVWTCIEHLGPLVYLRCAVSAGIDVVVSLGESIPRADHHPHPCLYRDDRVYDL